MRARLLVTTALIALSPAAAPAAAAISDQRLASDPEVLHVDTLGGTLLWTHRDEDDQYRALVRIGGGPPRELPPQSSQDLDPKLGTDASRRQMVSYRRCSDDGRCGLYRLDVATGRETSIVTHPPRGCSDDHPVVAGARLVFGRTCGGARGSGVFVLTGDRVRRIVRLDGARVGAVDSDGRTVGAVAYGTPYAYVHAARISGSGHATLFRSSAARAGIDATFPSVTVSAGAVTWAYHGDGEHGTDGAIFRARAKRGAPCARELRRFSTDPAEGTVAPAELTGVGADGSTLYYGVAQSGVYRASSPPPAFRVSGSPATDALGAGCDFSG